MNEQIIRKTYLLINEPVEIETNDIKTETITLQDGTQAQLINQHNFTIKEISIDDIEISEWFIFVEENGRLKVSVNDQGYFIWLCLKNNKNGSIQAKTIHLTADESEKLVEKINKMLNETIVEYNDVLIEADITSEYTSSETGVNNQVEDIIEIYDINDQVEVEDEIEEIEDIDDQLEETENIPIEEIVDDIVEDNIEDASQIIETENDEIKEEAE